MPSLIDGLDRGVGMNLSPIVLNFINFFNTDSFLTKRTDSFDHLDNEYKSIEYPDARITNN